MAWLPTGAAGDGPPVSVLPEEPSERLVALVHDLRTPLVVVQGFADLLATRPNLTEDQRREFAGRVAEGARELVALLDAERVSRPQR